MTIACGIRQPHIQMMGTRRREDTPEGNGQHGRPGYKTPHGSPVALARGTRDIDDLAHEVVRANGSTVIPVTRDKALCERLAALLREAAMSTSAAARALRASVSDVAEALLELLQARRVYNVGSEDQPEWSLKLGEHASAPEVRGMVRRLITTRAMTTHELSEAIGVPKLRVSAAIASLRQEHDVVKAGGAITRWMIVARPKRRTTRMPKF